MVHSQSLILTRALVSVRKVDPQNFAHILDRPTYRPTDIETGGRS
jgi:hypothetical protein